MDKINIYIGHSRDRDYESIYQTIEKNMDLEKFNFLLPHKMDKNSRNGRAFYNKSNIDIFIAEVSQPSTGLGIEMGWAYEEQIPIYGLYKKGSIPSNAIKSVSDYFIEYNDIEDFINKLKQVLIDDGKES